MHGIDSIITDKPGISLHPKLVVQTWRPFSGERLEAIKDEASKLIEANFI